MKELDTITLTIKQVRECLTLHFEKPITDKDTDDERSEKIAYNKERARELRYDALVDLFCHVSSINEIPIPPKHKDV